MVDLNLGGVFATWQAALAPMLDAGWGRLLAIASTAGLKGYPYVAGYCAAKHGVVGLTRALALETAKTGVTVNAVCPGYMLTPMLERSIETIMAEDRPQPRARPRRRSSPPTRRAASSSRTRSPPPSSGSAPTAPPRSPARRSRSREARHEPCIDRPDAASKARLRLWLRLLARLAHGRGRAARAPARASTPRSPAST